MATGRTTQLTRQIGEHLVVSELGRRGYVATPFSGNVPLYDVLAADRTGRAVPIQVKAINGPSWQFSATTFLSVEVIDGEQIVRGKTTLPDPDLLCIFVFVRKPGEDEFFIFRLRYLQEHFARWYKSGRRPNNPNSMHCAIWPKDLEQFRNNWELVDIVLGG